LDQLRHESERIEGEVDRATAAERRAEAGRNEAARRVTEARAKLDSLPGAGGH